MNFPLAVSEVVNQLQVLNYNNGDDRQKPEQTYASGRITST